MNLKAKSSQTQSDVKSTSCKLQSLLQYDPKTNRPPPPMLHREGGRYTFQSPTAPGTHMICREKHVIRSGLFNFPGPEIVTDWRLCDQITVCGVKPTSVTRNATGRIVNEYPVSSNCSSSMDVKLFDAVGNTSPTINSSFYDPSTPQRKPPILSSCRLCGTPGCPDCEPTSTPSNESPNDQSSDYIVAGIHFDSLEAAQKASKISGYKIEEIDSAVNPKDRTMNKVAGNLKAANKSAKSTSDMVDSSASMVSNPNAPVTGDDLKSMTDATQSAAQNIAVAQDSLNQIIQNTRLCDSGKNDCNTLGPIGEAAIAQAEKLVEMAKEGAQVIALADAVQKARLAVQSAQAALSRASSAYTSCKNDVDEDGSSPDCSSESSAVRQAQAALTSAQNALSAAEASYKTAKASYDTKWAEA